ncbi:serine/threonine protein kinase MEK1 PWA37_002348 [Arxiozyma heterogenica]|uniref:serine/threonine protein kinase MEK1 n=1 Tax=Arxiozyma heterogenica TaxID=278026 RepID=UPI002F1331AA
MERTLGYLEIIDNGVDTASGFEVTSEDLKCEIDGYLALRKHSMIKIGRHRKECQLVLLDPSISSVHAIVWVTLFDEEATPMFYIKDVSLNGIQINGFSLKKGNTYLLQDNDIINIWSDNNNNNNKSSKILSEQDYCRPLFKFISRRSQSLSSSGLDIYEKLNISKRIGDWEIGTKVIGNGTFGHVLVCYRDRNCNNIALSTTSIQRKTRRFKKTEYAVKIIKVKLNKIDKEAKILLTLKHPNIIKVHRTFDDLNGNLYIFQDLIPGGDLFSYLAKGSCLSSIPESEALLIVFQILQALRYLHSKGIVHRDLKLDNILLCSPEPCTRIILADFGIAKHLTSDLKRMHTIVGTPEYCAPEVGFKADRQIYQNFSRVATIDNDHAGYDEKCDLWSLGVITHIMVSGISPFYGDGTEKCIIKNTKNGRLNFTTSHWRKVSATAKDFVRALLTVDVEKRLDSVAALDHSWVSKHIDQLNQIYEKRLLKTETNQEIEEVSKHNKESLNILDNDHWKKKLPKGSSNHIVKKVFKPKFSTKKLNNNKIQLFR